MIWDSLDVKYWKQQMDKLSNLNITLSQLRDDLRGVNDKTLSDLDTDLNNIYARLDVDLSTRASETTLSGIKGQTDKLTFDGNSYLYVNIGDGAAKIWDGTDYLEINTDGSINATIASALPTGDNWIGRVKIGDGTNIVSVVSETLAGSSVYGLATAPDLIKMLAGGTNYVYQEIATSTTEASTNFSPPLKFAVLSNQDTTNDILVRFNGGTATQITIYAGTAKVVMFPISDLYYVASAGTPTLVVNGFQ